MRAFNVGRAVADQRQDFFGLAVNHAQFRVQEMALPITMLNHLQILPTGLRLFTCRRSPPARIGRDLTIDRNHRVIDPAPAIRQGRRWGRRVSTCFQGLEDFLRGFRFRLGDAAGDPESGVDVQHGRAPELASGLGFGMVLFSPGLPTEAQSPSS